MSILSATASTAFESRTGISAHLLAALRWIARACRAFGGQRVVADLARMDDRMLRDIGLNRGDLRDAASGPLMQDPTVVLFRRASERRSARERYANADRAADIAERISRKHFVPYY
ncbi:MAG: DUF1127 domain-containing protein [Xanthobacteraceae bacterium]